MCAESHLNIIREITLIILLQGPKDIQIKIYWLSQECNLKCMVKEPSLLLPHSYRIRLLVMLEDLARLFCLRKNENSNFRDSIPDCGSVDYS